MLYDFPPLGTPVASSPSPFVGKVETVLRLAGLPFRKQSTAPGTSPRGQLPYMRHGPNTVADSGCILRYLRASFPQNEKLQALFQYSDPQAAGLAVAADALLEDRLRWLMLRYRWFDPGCFKRNVEVSGGSFAKFLDMPLWGVELLLLLQRRRLWSRCKAQGVGKLTPSEQWTLVEESVAALAGLLGSKPYFTGDEPKAVDAACFAFLDVMLQDGIMLPLRQLVLRHPSLVAYAERMRRGAYPEQRQQQEQQVEK